MACEGKNLDLSAKTFDEFVEFFFARDVVYCEPPLNDIVADVVEIGQDYDEAVPSSPEVLIEHMTRLFSEFGQIAPRYSLAQINRGIWTILGPGLELPDLLWDPAIPFSRRLQCIRSMYHVYSDFVAKSDVNVTENCFGMWWDLVAHDFWFQGRLWEAGIQMGDVSKLDAEVRTLLDAMFETLKRILELPDPRTQVCAMHGLGHLHHPAVRETVQEFIENHKSEFTEEHIRWLEECRDGTVM
ncbi:MAG TPA: hypothetical protein VMV59_01695 [Candidatus Dormibacteraeota bacterium]|nr:hypothetical protein [Candidatus Dormibacteraeota bacterium]